MNAGVRCLRCGYDLRAGDPAGVCPECGVPVAASLKPPPPLRRANRAWVRDQHVGLRLAVAAGALGLALLCVEVVTVFTWHVPEVVFVVPWAVALGTAAAAAWHLGRREPPLVVASFRGRLARATLTPGVLLPATRLVDRPPTIVPTWAWTLGTEAAWVAVAAGFAAVLSLAVDLGRRADPYVVTGDWSSGATARRFLACVGPLIVVRALLRLMDGTGSASVLTRFFALVHCPLYLALFLAWQATVAVLILATMHLRRVARGVEVERRATGDLT